MVYRIALYSALLMMTLAGCKKNSGSQSCEKLQEAMITNNTTDVKILLTQMINQLPSDIYTQQNLDVLSSSIASQCTISSQVVCFDCIKTLPSQSEIRLSFISAGVAIAKTIDISYSPDNKMQVINMHD